MNFDFYQQYKGYSNTELLKIVNRPSEYQPAAVAAATQLLNERQVTPEELSLVEGYFQDLDNATKARDEKINALKRKATDFIEPLSNPGDTVDPNKWVNILLLVITIEYAWTLYNTIKRLISFLQCSYCRIDISLFPEFITLVYVPFIFFLIFKRRRWGWILLFADNLFSLILRVSQSYIFFHYQDIHHGDTFSFILPIVIKTFFAAFLWRDLITDHFSVTKETKKKVALITTIGSLLFILVMYVIFRG